MHPRESWMTHANAGRLAMGRLAALILLVVGSARAGTERPEDLGVIPTPQEVTWIKESTNESLRVDEATKILLDRHADGRRKVRRQ